MVLSKQKKTMIIIYASIKDIIIKLMLKKSTRIRI